MSTRRGKGGGWADGQKARVRKQPQDYLGFIKADPISSHFSLKSAYL